MDIIFNYNQKKTHSKSEGQSICSLKLYRFDNIIELKNTFDFDYQKYGNKKHITFWHQLNINTNTGDIVTSYKIINDNLTEDRMFRNLFKSKKNDFSMIFDLTESGLERGEKRKGFWGVKYDRAIRQVISLIFENIKDKFKTQYGLDKIISRADKTIINDLYDMLVDFHLDVKGIKGHDSVYNDIQNEYPKKKWLEKNDYKFLPAVLDYYGIKSKYLISELNKNWDKPIYISSLNYLCKLFGSNYIDYLKQFVWESHCYDLPPNKKIHELKNESEKKCMVSVINKWEKDTLKSDSLIYSLNKLLSIRDLLSQRNVDLKFKAKNDHEFENTLEVWSGIKLHFARGFKVKYVLPNEFIDMIEEDIIIDGETFKPKLLVSEEDFRIEGYNMKNCMAKQFPHGAIYLYVALSNKRKRINLQYRRGHLVQSYGKANTAVSDFFQNAMETLTERFKKHPNIEWKKERYDYLSF